MVSALLRRSNVAGESLALELTEELFLADRTRAEQVMSALRALGVTLIIDDYGTGYSSLAYLRDLRHLGGLKIDRSFVTNVVSDARSAAIVRSTLDLASALDLAVVAGGRREL